MSMLRQTFALPSQGLGEELALYFATHGARLILSSRKEEQLQVITTYPLMQHEISCVWSLFS